MKNTKVLSLLLLLTSAEMYSAHASPDILFVLASQVLNALSITVQTDSDDGVAVKMLASMNGFIAFDAAQKKSLAAAQGGIVSKAIPLDSAKIEARDKELQGQINSYNNDIKKLKKSGNVAETKGSKIANRKASRDIEQKELDNNIARLKKYAITAKLENDKAALAQQNAAAINVLIAKNALAFENALESYLSLFGLVYLKAGSMYGSTIIISSKYNQDAPITLKEYSQLMTTLRSAASQFGSSIQITLELDRAEPVSIAKVADYIGNMPPATSYATYAAYGIAAAGLAAAAIAGAAIVYNYSQGKDLTDATDAMNIYKQGAAGAQNTYNQFGKAMSDLYNNAANSSTGADIEAGFKTLTPAQQQSVNNAVAQDPQLAAAAAQLAAEADHLAGYESLYSDIEAMIDGENFEMTADEVHLLAPYAAGILLAGTAGLAGVAAVSLVANEPVVAAFGIEFATAANAAYRAGAGSAIAPHSVLAANPSYVAAAAARAEATAAAARAADTAARAADTARAFHIAHAAEAKAHAVSAANAAAVSAGVAADANFFAHKALAATRNAAGAAVLGTAAGTAANIAVQGALTYGAAVVPGLAVAGAIGAAGNADWGQYLSTPQASDSDAFNYADYAN